jgi:hypothetical protein
MIEMAAKLPENTPREAESCFPTTESWIFRRAA